METKSALLFSLLFLAAALTRLANGIEFTDEDLSSEESLKALYERWGAHHKVSREPAEKEKRFNVFKANAEHVQKANGMDKPYKLKLNKFADMTNLEFRNMYGSKIKHHRAFRGARASTPFAYEDAGNLPDSVDWRKKGAVTEIKNQGECGSCWAFSTVAGVEGINKLKTGELVSLSEQELVDCEKDNHGCDGGLMESAFEFIKKKDGLTTERAYPYKAKGEKCDSSKGVFTGDCGTELDHGVAVVGYGSSNDGTKYWIVKNSWGTDWGEKGYFRLQRDVDAQEGLCGIAMDASYPVKLSSDNPKPPLKDEL